MEKLKKKLNLWVLTLTLLMGVSFTSCLDSGDSEFPYDAVCTVYVQSFYGMEYYFEDALGNTYYPTAESLSAIEQNNSGFDLADYKMLTIYFKFVEDENTTTPSTTDTETTTPQRYDIELVMLSIIEVPDVVVAASVDDIETVAPGTAPLISLHQYNSYGGDIVPQMFDDKTVMMQTGFYYTSNSTEKFNMHSIKMVYVPSEFTEDSQDLTVYLQHDKGDDDGVTASYSNYYAFNLQHAIETFKSRTGGNTPRNIIIKVKEVEYDPSVLPEDYSQYEVEYKTTNE